MKRMRILAAAALFLAVGPVPLLAEGTSRLVKVSPIHFEQREQAVTLTGEVIARVQSDLSFRVSGRITGWFVDVGAVVKAGQVLARLDPEEQQADLEAAEAGVRAAEAQLRLARTSLDRQKALLDDGISTQRDFDDAETAVRTAEGALEAAIAQRDTAREVLSYTELAAPADGIVTARHAETGQVAQAAQTMFTLADNGPRDAAFDVYESLFFERPAANGVEIVLLSDSTVRTTGTVREISPTVDANKGTVRVKVSMAETPAAMTLGSSVIGIGSLAPRRVAVVPWQALSGIGSDPALWILDPKDNSVSLRRIEVASFETGTVLVASGVEEGEIYVADGTKLLRPGQIVSTTEGDAQ